MVFTDWVPDINLQNVFGFYHIGSISAMMVINVLLVLYYGFKLLRLITKKNARKTKHNYRRVRKYIEEIGAVRNTMVAFKPLYRIISQSQPPDVTEVAPVTTPNV